MLKRNWSRVSAMSFALLVVSVGMNALQAKRIRALVEPSPTISSRVGKLAQPLAGWTVDSQSSRLVFNQRQPTVLYYFSSSCRWCEQNWSNVQALAKAASDRFRFVAVSDERIDPDFVRERRLAFEILGGISAEARRAFGFSATPHTVVVSSEGRISHEWAGAFSNRRERQIEAFFDVVLPGLDPLSGK